MSAAKFGSLLGTYRHVLIAGLSIVVVATAYWPTFARMVDMWTLITYQHGWLVLPVSLYVLWRRRDALAAVGWRASWAGVAVTALLVAGWLVASSVGVQVVEFISATLVISALYWAVAGTAAMRKAAFPLLLLLTAVPTGEFLVQHLMRSTAWIASGLLALAGVPVLQDGQFFNLPGGAFEVADVCSGLRYLLAGVMASLAYAYVTYSSNIKRAVFVGVTSAVLVVTNGVRAFIVMYVASATEMQVFGGVDHVWFGMVLFAAVFIAMVWGGERYADLGGGPDAGSSAGPTPSPGLQRNGASLVAMAVAILLVVGGPLLQFVKVHRDVSASAVATLPALPGCGDLHEWVGELSPGFPQFEGADRVLQGTYACPNSRTSVYIAEYMRQEQGKELIGSGNRVWPHHWRRFAEETTASVAGKPGRVDVNEVRISDPEQPLLIWYWYQVGDAVTASKARVKMLEARNVLSFLPVTSSVIVVVNAGAGDVDVVPERRAAMESRARMIMSWNQHRAAEAR